MKSVELKGIISPILTPMNEDGSLNLGGLIVQVDRMIDNGIHGIFAFGTNGEGYILSGEEKKIVLETVVNQAQGRVPVYAGTGAISTQETIEQSQMAQEVGADILSVITPSFAAASQEELYIHFKTVAESVDLPIVLYNIPARTGNSIEPSTVERLSKIENIIGVKDSSGNFANILAYIKASKSKENGNFHILSGNDQLIIWTLLAGGTGGIAGCANVYPKTMSSIYDLFIEGKVEEAKDMNDRIQTLRSCFKYGNPNTIIKTATRLLGYDVGYCRAPFNLVSQEGIDALKEVIEENRIQNIF
ncbi:4-hydroxy-tetrahydrodipicolinate synthase [Staphylococcus shinii]|uniref:4-hydroxy-tetrahydrodipicolinate synthase n=1 Tax=Staphylococcus shinii TaxID=2912228 RepID=UPI003F861D1D